MPILKARSFGSVNRSAMCVLVMPDLNASSRSAAVPRSIIFGGQGWSSSTRKQKTGVSVVTACRYSVSVIDRSVPGASEP